MISPISFQKRLSVIVNPYDPPSPVSPVFDLLTPLPYSPCPYSPDPSPPSSPPPVRLTQQPFAYPQALTSDSLIDAPTPRVGCSPTVRPKSPATLELILDFESRIAELESRHTRISVQLEETRDALNSERAERRSSRRFSTLSHARFSSISSGSDGQASDQNDADYERRLKEELQDSLKKLRAQNAMISRSLRQKEEACASLSSALEEERSTRKTADEEVARLSALNFTLLEHNKLLVGRDAALQEDISSLITKSQADEWMRGVLETELRRRGQANADSLPEVSQPRPEPDRRLSVTLEHQGSIRAELVSTRDELHIAQVRLSTTEQQCTTLTQRVTSLQKQLGMCLDSSSQALEVERDLRADVEERARVLADENAALKARLTSLQETFPDGQASEVSARSSSSTKDSDVKRRPVSSRLQKKSDFNPKMDAYRSLHRHRHVLTSTKLREHRKKRLSMAKQQPKPATPTLRTFSIPKPVSIQRSLDTPMSPESTCSTKVASPGPSPSPKRNKRMSVILAATLSKDSRPSWSALKTNSSRFVDVSSRMDEPMTQLDTAQGVPVKRLAQRPKDLRTYMMRRASAIFIDLAHSYSSVDTVQESPDELFV